MQARIVRALVLVFAVLIVGVPAVATTSLVSAAGDMPLPLRALLLAIVPVVFALAYVATAGVLSLPVQRAIVSGKFPRALGHRIYGPRRLYGLCWTMVYYAGPIYQLVLSIPIAKAAMLRLFGYRGDLDVVVYADTWIRDLPLLKIGKGAYLSNKATIGTNICLQSGDILVDRVEIMDGGLVGHLAMLGPGAIIGRNAEIGVGCAIGIKTQIGDAVRVGPQTLINHGAVVGAAAQIGSMVYVGVCARIGDGVRVPSGVRIPDRAVVRTQAELDVLIGRTQVESRPRLAA